MAWKLNPSTGLIEGIEHQLSPNRDLRPLGTSIELLVIHNISLPPGQFEGDAVEAFFQNRLNPTAHPYFEAIAHLKVSSHFFIRRNGHIIQFVPCHERAWHAGQSEWRGKTKCNDFSIGIELEGTDFLAFTPEQYRTLAYLSRLLLTHYPIKEVVGHSDISPGRKTDPGAAFDWNYYRSLINKLPSS